MISTSYSSAVLKLILGEIFDYWFNLLTSNQCVQILYFFMIQSWQVVRFEEFIHFV